MLEWDFHKPEVKWFIGGKLNITENCIDRHLPKRANQTRIIWEPNDPKDESRKITYQKIHEQVCQVANMLRQMELKKAIAFVFTCLWFLNSPYAVLACARIGAVHSVVFAGFPAGSLVDQNQ